jgi:hypothetical protein
VTEDGIQIDGNEPQFENAAHAIAKSCGGLSKVTLCSAPQSEKQFM